MNQSTETTRPDPLLDAYRQASVREGARAGANVRAAVLAHARVVAQSSGAAVAATGLTDATRATPAANESKPIWRLAAGVVIGLVGVWIFQLTRPSAAPDTAVAVITGPSTSTAPQADKARAAALAVAAAPAAPPAAAAPEATAAVAAPPAAKDSAAKPASAARERQPEAALPEQNLAMAKVLAPKEKTNRSAVFSGAAATAAPASTADTSASAMSNEIVIASAEMRKSAKVESRAQPSSAAPALSALPPAATPPTSAPNAFPAQVSEVIVAAAPAPRPAPASPAVPAVPAAAATVAAPWQGGALGATAKRGIVERDNNVSSAGQPQASTQMSDATRSAPLGEAELAMFKAVRAGNVPALRIAIARGVNVNVRDERGRTALQIARERADVETIKLLEAAGAR